MYTCIVPWCNATFEESCDGHGHGEDLEGRDLARKAGLVHTYIRVYMHIDIDIV